VQHEKSFLPYPRDGKIFSVLDDLPRYHSCKSSYPNYFHFARFIIKIEKLFSCRENIFRVSQKCCAKRNKKFNNEKERSQRKSATEIISPFRHLKNKRCVILKDV
jgi:hypothetical protein